MVDITGFVVWDLTVKKELKKMVVNTLPGIIVNI